MDTATVIFLLQVVCCALLFTMYIPQILKISHSHSVVGVSLAYNYIKVMLTIVSAFVLELSSNSFIVIMAQYVSLGLGGILLAQIIFLMWKNGDKKQIYNMIVVVAFSFASVVALTIVIEDVMTLISVLQVASFIVMFAQYFPQIKEIIKCKTVGDNSMAHWICKLVYSAFALGILVLAHNCLIVALTQVFNFIFTAVIVFLCIHYNK